MTSSRLAAIACAACLVACAPDETERNPPEGGSGLGKGDAVVGSFDPRIDYQSPTHILAIGYSHGMGDLFVQAATARARRYRELYPADQIVFFASPEVTGVTDTAALQGVGIRVISEGGGDVLSGPRLLASMGRFAAIRSFDVYGHSSPWGLGLESEQERLGTDTPASQMRAIAGSFTPDAYATLNGCNAGMYAGPYFSKMWRIPVAAALTASNFSRPRSDGHWYVNDQGQYPTSGSWLTTNNLSYASPVACSRGACYRLHPENAPYTGYWGTFSGGGLGFYKIFCAASGSTADCARRMAGSLLSYPSEIPLTAHSSTDDVATVVADFLCPTRLDLTARQACRDGLYAAYRDRSSTYAPFDGNVLDCSLMGCTFELSCARDEGGAPLAGTCGLSAPQDPLPKVYVEEFLLYLDGFAYLTGREPMPPPQGVIDDAVLRSVDRYRVNAGSLNCRQGAGSERAVVTVVGRGQTLWAEAEAAGAPRIATTSTGNPWLRVRRGAGGPSCYVSASYSYLTPVTVEH